MTLRARELWWRKAHQRRERQVNRQRAKTMDLQRRFHRHEPGVSPQMVNAAKAQLARDRASLRKAADALAKVRAQQAGASAPPLLFAEDLGLGFTYPFGLKGPVTRGAGHYTAGHRAADAADLRAEMRADHRYHASKGWGGLSYEYMVADDGTIGCGSPTNRKSAAVALNNTGMVNVCCPGTTGDRLTPAQERSVRWLLDNAHTSKLPKAHRLPRPARDVGWRGHREYPSQSTACPGDMLGQYHELFRRTG